MSTDRFRYLPCALHPALEMPHRAPGRHEVWEPQPDVIMGQRLHRIHPHVDLATGPGWDHAVRAYVAIRGGSCDESNSVSFEWTACGWEVVGARVPPCAERRFPGVRFDTPTGRREALCRCVYAALNLDVDGVFPVERA